MITPYLFLRAELVRRQQNSLSWAYILLKHSRQHVSAVYLRGKLPSTSIGIDPVSRLNRVNVVHVPVDCLSADSWLVLNPRDHRGIGKVTGTFTLSYVKRNVKMFKSAFPLAIVTDLFIKMLLVSLLLKLLLCDVVF